VVIQYTNEVHIRYADEVLIRYAYQLQWYVHRASYIMSLIKCSQLVLHANKMSIYAHASMYPIYVDFFYIKLNVSLSRAKLQIFLQVQ